MSREMHPGFGWLIGPTCDWRKPAPGAIHWVAYGPPDADGTAEKFQGFTETWAEAELAIAEARNA